jgi:hypothetical protein
MKITNVERFVIPITTSFEGSVGPPKDGTTVSELIDALWGLPSSAFITLGFSSSDEILVNWYKPDLDSADSPAF